MTPAKLNAKFNPGADPSHAAGNTRWATIGAIVLSLMIGTAAMLSGLVFSFQRYFESTIEIID